MKPRRIMVADAIERIDISASLRDLATLTRAQRSAWSNYIRSGKDDETPESEAYLKTAIAFDQSVRKLQAAMMIPPIPYEEPEAP